MSGIVELAQLLKSIDPELIEGEYVFCTLQGQFMEYAHLNPKAAFIEQEGLTLVLPKQRPQ